jgi:Ca-activated chloride channel family protein
MLWLVAVPLLLSAVYVFVQRRRQKYALRYASLSMIKEAVGSGPGIRRHIPPVLFLVALAVMAVALARPQAVIRLPSQEGTVVLVMDVSISMLAEDVTPNRLEAAKAAAIEFIQAQPSNVRIGLVAFGGTAYIAQPPTQDREVLNKAVSTLTPQRGTAIGRGLLTGLAAVYGTAESRLQPSELDGIGAPVLPPIVEPLNPGSNASTVIVLLSDGQSNSGPPPLEVIDQAAMRGVRVFTVGLGSPEGTVIRFQGRANRVMLDEQTLKEMARDTGAQYFHATTGTDLSAVYRDLGTRLVFKTEKTELTAMFTAAAAVVLLAAGGLSLAWFHRLP